MPYYVRKAEQGFTYELVFSATLVTSATSYEHDEEIKSCEMSYLIGINMYVRHCALT